MKLVDKLKCLLVIGCFATTVNANDGAFYMSGNQLVPINETRISVQKEILTIKAIPCTQEYCRDKLSITVYYEFFNPDNDKTLLVGFEAPSPAGDAETEPKNGAHPYIYDFKVEMNNKAIPHKIHFVPNSLYYKDGKINETKDIVIADGWTNFNYVYSFNAPFKKGINTVKHTYTFEMSGSVDFAYWYNYILTAANRWGNKQIDDFTLIIDMGQFKDFYISDSPFGEQVAANWKINGKGWMSQSIENANTPVREDEEINTSITATHFFIQYGEIELKIKNFQPKDELVLYSYNPILIDMDGDGIGTEYDGLFDHETYNLFFDQLPDYTSARNELAKKILYNYPFARRGYVFTSPKLKKYYQDQLWYKEDKTYKPEIEKLSKEEQEWIKKWSK